MPDKMKMKQYFVLLSLTGILFFSCKSTTQDNADESKTRTPVTITHTENGSLTDAVELNATSAFLLKTPIKSDINGYLEKVNVHPGQKVSKGQELFTIRSKEAEHLGNTISRLDSTFKFNGRIPVKAPSNGYITQLTFSPGDYVQDGEIIATISDLSSLVFLLDLPYELTPYIHLNTHPEIILPDGRHLQGTLESALPSVDAASQTQSYKILISENADIPENLIARVKFVKFTRNDVISLPKEAVLTNESQDEWWIMKMTDSVTAVKIPIKKGLETTDRVEIIDPQLKITDKILLTGNYGLPDKANVTIENKK